ncbi:uncharacterized protein [Bombus fervidus]|uniref:uncharacterized protein n=1 Tax=Bombus fervidus TaxID=203811 RepID=UPI003AB27046
MEEDCSMCDEEETPASEDDMETHEKLFTTESELNIINKRSRPGQKGKKLSLTAKNETDGYAKRHIMKGQVKTTFYLIIDHHIRDHIIKCTEKEAFRALGTKRELDATKLDAFIALLYARGAYQTKNLDVSYLWNKISRPAFFSKTMSKNDFAEIMRFI